MDLPEETGRERERMSGVVYPRETGKPCIHSILVKSEMKKRLVDEEIAYYRTEQNESG